MVKGHISILFLKHAIYNCSSTFMTEIVRKWNLTSVLFCDFIIRDIEQIHSCSHVKNFVNIMSKGPYFIWQLSFVTLNVPPRSWAVGWIGYFNTVDEPTGNDKRYLSVKIKTL